MLIQQLVNGISIGGIYALLASGYALVYSILGFSNWAHGEVAMLGAYIGLLCFTVGAFPFWLSIVIAIAGAALISMLNERVAYSRIRKKKGPTMFMMIAAMGISIFYQNLIIVTIGPKFKVFPPIVEARAVTIGGISLGVFDVVSLITAIILLLIMTMLIEKTKFGLGVRASASDMKTASLLGINVGRYIAMVFLLAGALAGVAGMLLGLKYNVYPQMGNIATKAFIASVLGGLGSVSGAILGAICVGLLETLVAAYISSSARDIFVFALLICVLLIKPSGFFGKYIEDKA